VIAKERFNWIGVEKYFSTPIYFWIGVQEEIKSTSLDVVCMNES